MDSDASEKRGEGRVRPTIREGATIVDVLS